MWVGSVWSRLFSSMSTQSPQRRMLSFHLPFSNEGKNVAMSSTRRITNIYAAKSAARRLTRRTLNHARAARRFESNRAMPEQAQTRYVRWGYRGTAKASAPRAVPALLRILARYSAHSGGEAVCPAYRRVHHTYALRCLPEECKRVARLALL